jgi:hypothetical protein
MICTVCSLRIVYQVSQIMKTIQMRLCRDLGSDKNQVFHRLVISIYMRFSLKYQELIPVIVLCLFSA